MVYLKSSVPHLVDNINLRGRRYEQNMRLDYLKNLNDRYDKFFARQYKGKSITIDVEGMDFLHRRADFAAITKTINKKLNLRPTTLFETGE